MNILVIAHFQHDGSPYVSFVHDQVLAYKALGHNVCVVSPVVRFKKEADIYAGVKEKYVDGIKVYYPRYFSLSNYGLYGMNSILGFHAMKRLLSKLIGEFKPDIIHAHTIEFDGAIAIKIKQKHNVPVVITTHGSDTTKAIDNGKEDYITEICRNADAVVAVSRKIGKLLMKEGINTSVICNGFNIQNCTVAEHKRKHSIIQVSNLIKQKKVDITIKSVFELKKDYNDITLTIVGEGPEKKYLMELCDKMNLSDIVTFTGRISNKEVLKKMAETEIFIMPSINEGLGIVYLEAMASGCVTIGTQGEGISDIIEHGVNGFLVDADHPEIISSLVNKCFYQNDYRNQIITNGKESVKNLTWEDNAKKYITLFTKILNGIQ